MMNETTIWLERLASLHKSQMRRAASEEGLQLVHLEVLQYVALCNRYSNTALALTEYLGQTKGSISQSLKLMETMGYLKRKADPEDKRVSRLSLTREGDKCLLRIRQNFTPDVADDLKTVETLKELLKHLQRRNESVGFGQCKSCRYNQKLGDKYFRCGLTQEKLSSNETLLICKEHEFPREN